MKCNKCGKEIPEESKYCMYCGEPIADQLALEDGAITINVGIGSFVMNLVEHGTFEMGATAEQQQAESNESPAHKVTLSHDYYIGQTAVPQWLYRSITGSNPSKYTGDRRPVDSVSYGDAKDFINKLNMKVASQLNGKKFRLPTEAEWEYAARGGKKSQHTLYAGSNDANEVAWNNTNLTKQSTVPMCQKKPNELGLYDMSGNVNEWCLDWRKKYLPEEVIDPVGKAFLGSKRVVRGGSWNGPASSCRVSFRDGRDPDTRSSDVGIRLVLS